MIELEFWPDISREEIRLASRTQKGEEYPESVYEEKSRLEARSRRTKWIAITILSLFALLTGISLINMVLQPESYRDLTVTLVVVEGTVYLICAAIIFGLLVSLEGAGKPAPLEARVSTFYSGLGLSPLESFARSYFIVAPHAMERLSQQKFINSWKSVKEDINRKVSHQEAVNCAHCGTKSEGMWIKDRVILEDDFQAGKKLFIQCPECNSEYCWKCYIGFTDGHQCPNVKRNLKRKDGWLLKKPCGFS